MTTLLLATRNPGKIQEITAILDGLPLRIQSLLDYPDIPNVVEDGTTLETNALKKSHEIFQTTGLLTLSDDTGLEVFSLEMRPGVFSARYAGESATYEQNYRKLLAELKGFPMSRRKARFRCVTVLTGQNIERSATGTCHGHIIEEPRGTGGFGYDPVFVPNGYSQTFAELPAETKNQISHRAKAFQRMKKVLAEFVR
jgi:XTP/dITP diphosphohydrolase